MANQEFIDNIKQWVSLDNQIKKTNEQLKLIRNKKQLLCNDICSYMKMQEIQNKIEISDGYIKTYERKEYAPLSYIYVEKCLKELIKDDNQVLRIMNYLKEKREIKVTSDLKRNTFSEHNI